MLCPSFLKEIQIICGCHSNNVLLWMPSSVENLVAKVQAFHCYIIFLSLACDSYSSWFQDLPWLAEFSTSLQAQVLLASAIKNMKEVVV